MLQSKYREADWIKKEPTTSFLKETPFRVKDTHRLKVREWKRYLMQTENDKEVGVSILILDKIDFKTVYKERHGHYI